MSSLSYGTALQEPRRTLKRENETFGALEFFEQYAVHPRADQLVTNERRIQLGNGQSALAMASSMLLTRSANRGNCFSFRCRRNGKTAGYMDKLLGYSIAAEGAVIRDDQSLRTRKGFLDFAAYGENGPDAAGVKAAVGQNYSHLYADTKAKLDVVRLEDATHGARSVVG